MIVRRSDLVKEIKGVLQKWYRGTSFDEVFSDNRTPRAVRARQMVMWYVWFYYNWSTTRIGRLTDRDHSTVIYGIGQHMRRAGLSGGKVYTSENARKRNASQYRINRNAEHKRIRAIAKAAIRSAMVNRPDAETSDGRRT